MKTMEGRFPGRVSCVVDTDIAIDYLMRRSYAKILLMRWTEDGLLAVSTITHLEIHQGMKPGEEQDTIAFLDGFVSLPVDVPTARRAGALLRDLRAQGITVSIADAIVAATALGLGAPLLTNSTAHYPFPGLQVEKGFNTGIV